MAPDRAETIERSYRAFREGDLDGLLAVYHPEAVWDMTRWEGFPDARTYEGREGMEEVLRLLRDVFGELDVRPADIVEVGEGRVLVIGSMRVRGRASGAEVDAPPFGQVFEFRDGLIARVDNYSDADAARRAAGSMSDHRERLVWEAIGAVNDGDVDAIVAMTAPDAEYEMVGGFADIVGDTVLRGPEGLRRFYTDWFATFTSTSVTPTAFLEAGERLLMLASVEVTVEGSDAPVAMDIGQIYTFKDGGIARVASYYDAAAALEAAGLTERDVRAAPVVTGPPAS